jgi:hypothetical protein
LVPSSTVDPNAPQPVVHDPEEIDKALEGIIADDINGDEVQNEKDELFLKNAYSQLEKDKARMEADKEIERNEDAFSNQLQRDLDETKSKTAAESAMSAGDTRPYEVIFAEKFKAIKDERAAQSIKDAEAADDNG